MSDLPSNHGASDRDDDLLRRVNGGESDAVMRIFEAHRDYLRLVLRGQISTQLRRDLDTEDLLHATIIRAVESCGSVQFDGIGGFRAWLTRVLINTLRERQRQRRRIDDHHDPRTTSGILDQHANPEPSDEAILENAEEMSRMFERIHRLDPADRDIVLARIVHERSWADIAKTSGLAPSTASKRFQLLLERLVREFR